ncbi:hypothetical protein GLOIN_2v1555135 [Rhizophagus clarus]|uniref:Uncharacterized protein n=1 Tax=Rhizophagus clarus TaxID=94130 RepID=A0A8H3M9K1_9GLOM|nr:hypothetical protein GLOIN_2v1555135 [Rhizophagus clarus]
MSTVSSSSPSNAHETTLPSNLTSETTVSTNDTISLLSEITSYFVRRDFQSSLIRSFLERKVHLDLKTNGGISGVVSGEDERLLVKRGLTEEAAREFRHSYPRNQWNSYDRKGRPQMFASSYQDIIDMGIDELLSRINLDFGSTQSFYLNPSLDNTIDLIKNIEGFNRLVVYWVDIDKIKGMNYRDLVSEGKDLWKEVVIASRCGQPSVMDNNDYVYGYQLSNPRPILSQWANCNENDEDS